MKTALIACLTIISCLAYGGDIYKRTGPDGKVFYTDVPPGGDESREVKANVHTANQASVTDHVQRAITTCSPVKGTSRYGPCMTDAANSICKSLSSREALACFDDFVRYHLSEANRSDNERKAMNEETERLIKRLKASVQ